MAVTIGNGSFSNNGAVIEASDGTKVAVFVDSGSIEVWKDIDGTPSLVDSDTSATIHGGGAVSRIDAAIGSNDDIHIVSQASTEQTRDIAYAVCDLTTGLGAWEEAADYTEQAPAIPGPAISIDASDYPHIFFTDAVKITGSTQDNVYYTERTGGSWSSPEQIGLREDKADNYFVSTKGITHAPNDDIETFYKFETDGDMAYRRRNGTWGNENVYIEGGGIPRGVVVTTGDVPYRCHITGANIKVNNVDTSYNSGGALYGAIVLVGTTRYVFFVDASNDVRVISNDGGGWTDESAQQTGTYTRVIAEWAYHNENQSGEINYIFSDGSNVYYDSFSLGADPEISKSESITVTENADASVQPATDVDVSNISDNITATENVDADIVAPPLSITGVSDNITATENVVVEGGANPNTSDSVAVVDIAHYYDNVIFVTENVDAAVVEPPAPDRDVDVSDSITVTEYAEAYVQPAADVDVSVDEETIVVSENATIEDVPNINVEEDQSIAVTEYSEATVLAVPALNITGVDESVTVTENATIEDVPNIDKSDSVTVTENAEASIQVPVNVSDSITVTENVEAEPVAFGDLDVTGVSDNITVSENVVAEDIPNPDVSDSVTVTENVDASVSDPQISVQDSVTVTENVEVEDIANPDVSDSTVVSEFADISFVLEINKQESVTVTENVSVEDIANPIVSDSVTVTEYVEFFVSDPAVLVQDSITVTENIELGGVPNVGVQENISVTENVDVYYPVLGALAVSVSDDVTVTENVDVGHVPNPAVSDNVSVTENVDLDVIELTPLDATTSDSITVSDDASAEIALGVFADENVSVTENVDAAVSASQISVSDSVTVTENIEIGGLPNISVQDNVSVTENVDVYYPELGDLSLSVSDNISVAENAIAQIGLEIVVSDNISVTEDVTVYVQPIPPPALGIFMSPDNVDSYAVGIKVYA